MHQAAAAQRLAFLKHISTTELQTSLFLYFIDSNSVVLLQKSFSPVFLEKLENLGFILG